MRHNDDLIGRVRRASDDLDLRERPQPWFVGSGRTLMTGVLAVAALLVVARGATTWWLAEDAWRWIVGQADERPATINLKPSNGVPTTAARPQGNPARVFGADAYPPEAIRRNEQGRTVAVLTVGPDGRVIACAVQTGSGSGALDAATCARGVTLRFEPARDAAGQPLIGTYTMPVRWQLPE